MVSILPSCPCLESSVKHGRPPCNTSDEWGLTNAVDDADSKQLKRGGSERRNYGAGKNSDGSDRPVKTPHVSRAWKESKKD